MAEMAQNTYPFVDTKTLDITADENPGIRLEIVTEESPEALIGKQAVAIATASIEAPSRQDIAMQQARLRNLAHRILIARTRSDPFETDVRGGYATKMSKDGYKIDADNWPAFAECRNDNPDAMFVRGAAQNKAKALCSECDVRRECLADALENQIEWGVWGGMTERERRALLRKRNWRNIFPPKAKQAAEPQESA